LTSGLGARIAFALAKRMINALRRRQFPSQISTIANRKAREINWHELC